MLTHLFGGSKGSDAAGNTTTPTTLATPETPAGSETTPNETKVNNNVKKQLDAILKNNVPNRPLQVANTRGRINAEANKLLSNKPLNLGTIPKSGNNLNYTQKNNYNANRISNEKKDNTYMGKEKTNANRMTNVNKMPNMNANANKMLNMNKIPNVNNTPNPNKTNANKNTNTNNLTSKANENSMPNSSNSKKNAAPRFQKLGVVTIYLGGLKTGNRRFLRTTKIIDMIRKVVQISKGHFHFKKGYARDETLISERQAAFVLLNLMKIMHPNELKTLFQQLRNKDKNGLPRSITYRKSSVSVQITSKALPLRSKSK